MENPDWTSIGDILPDVVSELKQRSRKRKQIEYAFRTFGSREALKREIMRVLGNTSGGASHPMGQDIPGEDGYLILWGINEYVRRYRPDWNPEWDIEAVQIHWITSVEKDRPFKPHRGFKARRKNGELLDFSLKCLLPPVDPMMFVRGEAHDAAREAARVAIQPFIDAYRDSVFAGRKFVQSQFPGSSEILQRNESHVDHYDMQFEEAWAAFCKLKNIKDSEITFCQKETRHAWRFQDEVLEKDWIEFHNTHCHLRVISVKENLSISRRGNRASI